MNGHNISFITDPFNFAQRQVISALDMAVSNKDVLKPGVFKTAFNFVFTTDYEYAASNQLLEESTRILDKTDHRKKGKFDLEPSSEHRQMDFFRVCSPKDGAIPTGIGAEAPLRGYWCPYIPIGTQGAGLQNVPYVEFPRNLPDRVFVFTGAMNGCSIVITDQGNGVLRLYHDSTHTMQMFAHQNVITSLGYDANSGCAHTYAHAAPAQGVVPNSFNFLYRDNQGWHLVCQPQVIQIANLRVDFNPNIQPFEVQI